MAVFILPVLILVAIILAGIVYWKTKSFVKVGYLFEIIFAIVVFVTSTKFADKLLMFAIDLLGIGLLINGIIGVIKQK